MLGYGSAIVEIVTGLWDRFPGVPLAPAPVDRPPSLGDSVLIATVPITGGWDGAMVVAIHPGLAHRAAQATETAVAVGPDVVETHLAAFTVALTRDFAVMLPGACWIGPATVARGNQPRLRLPTLIPVLSEAFHSEGDGLVATVLQRIQPPTGD